MIDERRVSAMGGKVAVARWFTGVLVAAAAATSLSASPALAAPDPVAPTAPMIADTDDTVEPAAPMPVPTGAFGYLATRSATLWLADRHPDDVVRSLPVPPALRPSNDALAAQFERELDAAVRTPGACVQIIIDPQTGSGNLFDYGIWSVEKQYCPAS